jgi:acylphosphatase
MALYQSKIFGIVQGVGFRPFVARLAARFHICGSVCNKGPYVEVFAQGSEAAVDQFLTAIEQEPPERASILKLTRQKLDQAETYADFQIIESAKEQGSIFVSPDIATCDKCKAELFDPQDKRRDVAVTVTGSDGAGNEKLIPFVPNSKANGGGLSFNKWDENRQTHPWVKAQRMSGVNGPYMRLSEMYLGYAEACAALGDNGEARTYLDLIRNRAFGDAIKAKTDAFIAQEGSLLNAIIQERGFEFAAEGDRRFTLIRTGLLPVKIKYIKDLTRAMIDGLKTNGYYTFENGNTISDTIYTKMVNGQKEKGYRLTTQCPEGQEDDPLLYPGWRGQKDNWDELGCAYKGDTLTNLAIKGLFKLLSSSEISALKAEGYEAQAWGADIVQYEDEYYTYLFYDYDYTKAPIYLWPFTPQILSTGGFKNGYGFKNE